MKRNLIVFQMLVLSIFAQEIEHRKLKGEYAKIDTSRDKKVIAKLTSKDLKIRKEAISEILSAPNVYTPLSLYTLSRVLFNEDRKVEAVRWFYTGQLRARYDANRCADETARQLVDGLNQLIGPEINKYAFADKKLLWAEVMNAIEFVSKNPEEYDHRWINLHGMAAFASSESSSLPLSLPKSQWPKIKEKTIAEYKAGFEEAYQQIP